MNGGLHRRQCWRSLLSVHILPPWPDANRAVSTQDNQFQKALSFTVLFAVDMLMRRMPEQQRRQ